MARKLVADVYLASKAFPREELYGLTQQVRRAAVSVPSNIAEGFGRGSLRDYIHFLQMARGSLFEMQTQLQLARDLDFLPPAEYEKLASDSDDCSRVLQGLISSLQAKLKGTK